MQTARVVPCLDVDEGRVVKGVNFVGLRDAGDPVELAARYDAQGADEVVFLDITASSGERETMVDVVRRSAEEVFIPLTVGGGVRSVDDARTLLRAGADKVSVMTAAVQRPALVSELADTFGAQCVVVAIDARRREGGYEVFTRGGRQPTGIDAVAWAAEAEERGAGEILLTSMDRDGTRDGFDLELTRAVVDACNLPVVGRGGRRAAPTPCWPRRSSTSASTPWPRPRRPWPRPAWWSGPPRRMSGVPVVTPIAASDEALAAVKYGADGLVPAIVQEQGSGDVLMLAWMNEATLRRTLDEGRTVFWSRSRQEVWAKGETSGDRQWVRDAYYDCDGDVLLFVVEQEGRGACHTGAHTCFTPFSAGPAPRAPAE